MKSLPIVNFFSKPFFVILLFAVVCIFLTFNLHSKSGKFNYHSEIWADKAGYYIFLPATFIYGFDGNKLPADISVKTGDGFAVDSLGRIISKYPVGVAFMQVPFFIAFHLLADPLGYTPDGFSIIYHRMIDVSAVAWLICGLWFLWLYIRRYLKPFTSFLTLMVIFLGTNLYYYALKDTGMSHVYSFALFSILLFNASRYNDKSSLLNVIVIGATGGAILAVRPVNVVFLLLVLIIWWLVSGRPRRIRLLHLFIMFSTGLVILLPQLIYYKYLSGSFFYYSYQHEGFDYLFSPKVFNLWFAPNNGLFLYSPIILAGMAGLYFMRKKLYGESFVTGLGFLFISYIFASWWSWSYGCGYGSRPFVEYYVLMALPLGFLFEKVAVSDFRRRRFVLVVLLLFLVVLNLKMIYSYDGCWYASDWDWKAYFDLITRPTK